MKKYIILTTLILLSFSVQAKQNGFMEALNSYKTKQKEFSTGSPTLDTEKLQKIYQLKYEKMSLDELKNSWKKTRTKYLRTSFPQKEKLREELNVIDSYMKKLTQKRNNL